MKFFVLLLPKFSFNAALLGLLVGVVSSASVASALSTSPAIRVLRGASQQTTYGSAFPAALQVWVTDPATGSPLVGQQVNFTAGMGIGLSAASAVTDAKGVASVTATGLVSCTSQVRAEIDGVPGTSVTFAGLVVNKAVLTVVPADQLAALGGKLPSLIGYTMEGFVNGDTWGTAQITGSPVFTTTATDHSPHANYSIKGGAGTLSAPNYTFVAGFGTLAILAGPKSGSNSEELATISVPPVKEVAPQVQSALADRPNVATVAEPSFLAGLRGESGVFVRAAIWSNLGTGAAAIKTYLIRSAAYDLPMAIATAQPTFLAGFHNSSDVPVRAAELPAATPVVSSTRNAQVQAAGAMPVATVDAPRNSAAPVRAAMQTAHAPASAAMRISYDPAAIRKAFNPPGTR